jgi:hypothetical protein
MGFMNTVDLILAVSFLAEDLFKDCQFLFIVLQSFWWKFSLPGSTCEQST